METEQHTYQCQVEVGTVGYQTCRYTVGKAIELVGSDEDDAKEADDEHYRAPQSEEMHGLDAKLAEEPQRYQVEVTVDKTVEKPASALISARSLFPIPSRA